MPDDGHRMVKRVFLSNQGPEVSEVIYGTWQLGQDPEGPAPDPILAKIGACIEVGILAGARASEFDLEREDWYAIWEAAKGHKIP